MANPTPLSSAIKAVVATDDELAEKARALAHKAIRIANEYLDSGSPRMQLDVIKSIMPAIGRGMTEKGEDAEMALMREQIEQLMALVRGESIAS